MSEQKDSQINPESENTEQTSKEVIPDITIPTLRTYEKDVHQTVNKDKITTAKILLAEQNKKQKTLQEGEVANTSIKRPTNILILILTIILIIISIGGVGYVGYTKITKTSFTPISVPKSFIFVFDTQEFIDASQELSEIFTHLKSVEQKIKSNKKTSYTEIIFYKTNQNTNEKERITTGDFFTLFNINVPTLIIRSLTSEFTYGIYSDQNKQEYFLIVGVADYETTYNSMFVWESTLALDIKDIFPKLKSLFDTSKQKQINMIEVATSTLQNISTSTVSTSTISTNTTSTSTISSSSTTQEEITHESINRNIRFIDIIFSNKDVRAIRDQYGNPTFYYTFIDKTKILFAEDPKLLPEIIKKIKEKNLVR